MSAVLCKQSPLTLLAPLIYELGAMQVIKISQQANCSLLSIKYGKFSKTLLFDLQVEMTSVNRIWEYFDPNF